MKYMATGPALFITRCRVGRLSRARAGPLPEFLHNYQHFTNKRLISRYWLPAAHSTIELETKVHTKIVINITEKARVGPFFFWLKVPTSAFTFKTLLTIGYANQTLTPW